MFCYIYKQFILPHAPLVTHIIKNIGYNVRTICNSMDSNSSVCEPQ